MATEMGPMVTADLRTEALRHAMIFLRACGPITRDELRHELFIQTPGVTADNVDLVTDWVWSFWRQRRVTESYGDDGSVVLGG